MIHREKVSSRAFDPTAEDASTVGEWYDSRSMETHVSRYDVRGMVLTLFMEDAATK